MNIESEFIPLEKRTPRIIKFDDKNLETIFTDKEAVSICSGLQNSFARQIWKRYQQIKPLYSDNYMSHNYSMKTLNVYGFETVSFLLAIPPLKVGDVFSGKAFSILDKKKNNKKHQSIRLIDRYQVHYSIQFYYEIIEEEKLIVYEDSSFSHSILKKVKINKFDYDVLEMRKEGVAIARIHRSGKVSAINDTSVNQPVIELLVNFCEDPFQQILHYGTITAHCSNCGIPISNPLSIRASVGRDCARNLGIKWE